MKRLISSMITVLLLCTLLTGCANPIRALKKKEAYTIENTKSISLLVGENLANTDRQRMAVLGKDDSDGNYYFELKIPVNYKIEYSDFTLTKALEILNNMDIVEYEPEVADSGKKAYENIPLCIEVYSKANADTYTYRYYEVTEDCALMEYLNNIATESFDAKYPKSTNTKRVFETRRVFDYAEQLTDEEESNLEEIISGYERLLSLDLVIVTLNESLANYELEYRKGYSVDITPDKYVMVFANKFWEDYKFGYDSATSPVDTTVGDGIILVDNLAMEPETGKIYTWMGTTGDAMYDWSQQEIDYALDEFYRSVDTNYYQACVEYLQAIYAFAD